jgi:excisionase family DNA binding protein
MRTFSMNIPRTVTAFRRWLRAEIEELDDPWPDMQQYCEATDTIRQARRIAVGLGLPEVARICQVTFPVLAPPSAQGMLTRCLVSLPEEKADVLTVAEVARFLGVNRGKVLGWIRSTELTTVNVSQGHRPRYRVNRRDLEVFMKRRTKAPPEPRKPRTRKLPAGMIDFYPSAS